MQYRDKFRRCKVQRGECREPEKERREGTKGGKREEGVEWRAAR